MRKGESTLLFQYAASLAVLIYDKLQQCVNYLQVQFTLGPDLALLLSSSNNKV
jgi:hypothetical protein